MEETNQKRRYIYLAALIATASILFALIMSSGQADAATTKLSCTKGTVTQSYGFAGIDSYNVLHTTMDETLSFSSAVCDNGFVLYERTVANDIQEVRILQEHFMNSPRKGLQAFCYQHKGRALLITSPGNGISNPGFHVKTDNKAAFKKFLIRYAADNQCVVG